MSAEMKGGSSGKSLEAGRVVVAPEICKGCGLCVAACPVTVLRLAERFNVHGYHPAEYAGSGCTGCGICFYACPEPGAITLYTRVRGKTPANTIEA
jgi:NAD-dependent dihydropyrimidine dehydrogenase PreA subunit